MRWELVTLILEEESDAQAGEVIGLKPHSWSRADWGLTLAEFSGQEFFCPASQGVLGRDKTRETTHHDFQTGYLDQNCGYELSCLQSWLQSLWEQCYRLGNWWDSETPIRRTAIADPRIDWIAYSLFSYSWTFPSMDPGTVSTRGFFSERDLLVQGSPHPERNRILNPTDVTLDFSCFWACLRILSGHLWGKVREANSCKGE